MIKKTTLTLALSSALFLGLTSTASAQSDDENVGIPYEITFNGSLYPADLESVEYPYIAATQQRDGECLLNVISDTEGNIAGMSIVSCSDDLLRDAASRYINRQSVSEISDSNLTAHSLRISWDIGEELEETRSPLQLAAR